MVELLVELTLGLMVELMVVVAHMLVDMVLHLEAVMMSADYEIPSLLLKPNRYPVKHRKRKGKTSMK